MSQLVPLIALPMVAVSDTLRRQDADGRWNLVPRERLYRAQTPQGFRRKVLLTAYQANGSDDATDDVQLVERTGGKVVIVPSHAPNFKITTLEDLRRAEKVLDRQ